MTTPIQDLTRTCKRCCLTKPIEQFYKRKMTPQRPWKETTNVCILCIALDRKWYAKNASEQAKANAKETAKRRRERKKDLAFQAYGGYVCSCCGETRKLFLTIDHINNDGAKWRREQFGSRTCAGQPTYRWLATNGYPEGFQVLCMNCNHGKRMNDGICPHQVRSNDYPCRGVEPSGSKRSGPQRRQRRIVGQDIVSPALKNAAALMAGLI